MNKNPKLSNLKPFPKGVSGNPKGGQKKIPALDVLLSEIPEDDYAKIIEKLIEKAKKGDIRAAEVVLDRAFGKAKQEIRFDGEATIKTFQVKPASDKGTD